MKSSPEWVICERSGRWAAAVRVELARNWGQSAPHLFEVRHLGEISPRLAEHPHSLALVEVHRANIGAVLAWFAEATCLYPHARYVALLDAEIVASHDDAGEANTSLRHLANALREAGASDVVTSPRRLAGLLEWARRHAQRQPAPTDPSVEQSAIAWAWSSLPWQGT